MQGGELGSLPAMQGGELGSLPATEGEVLTFAVKGCETVREILTLARALRLLREEELDRFLRELEELERSLNPCVFEFCFWHARP